MHLEALRELCLSLPSVTEDVKWGSDLCFSVGGKMFCVTSIDSPHTVSFKVQPKEFEEITQLQNVIPAPYMARNKWVQVQEWAQFTEQEWENYIIQSYTLVKAKLPKKTQALL